MLLVITCPNMELPVKYVAHIAVAVLAVAVLASVTAFAIARPYQLPAEFHDWIAGSPTVYEWVDR